MTIEELQQQLADKIAKLDAERQTNAAKAAKEREELLLSIEIERRERAEAYEKKVAEHESKRRAEEAEREAQRTRDVAERVAAEQKQAALDHTLQVQREKLEWLTTAISNAEFDEEKHRKAIEGMRVQPIADVEVNEVSADYPQTCADGGASAEGTTGDTPETPLMSMHLRQILRQANKQ